MVVSILRRADGVLAVFDLTNYDSFTEVIDRIKKTREQLGYDDSEDNEDDAQNLFVPMVFVGNKLDLCEKP